MFKRYHRENYPKISPAIYNYPKKYIRHSNKKYYIVVRGYKPGIYTNEDKAKLQIKDFPNSLMHIVNSREKAKQIFNSSKQ